MPPPHPLTALHHRDPAAARAELSRLLREHHGNRSALARALGVHRDVVFSWIREWGLEVEAGRDGRPAGQGEDPLWKRALRSRGQQPRVASDDTKRDGRSVDYEAWRESASPEEKAALDRARERRAKNRRDP